MSRTTGVSQYQKKHSPTHTYRGHQSSLICFLHLLRSMISSLFNLRAWKFFPQSFCKFSLVYFFAWHPPLHIPYISSPSRCFLFAAHALTIATCFAVVPRLCHLILVSLNPLLNATHPSDHSHLCPLKCHIVFLSYGPGLTSMQHSTSHTTAVQSPSHYQWCIGKQWYQLPELFHPIRILVSTAASASPSTQNLSTNSRFALTPVSKIVHPCVTHMIFIQSKCVNIFVWSVV